jgi:drug/metabolite transporter (DMT)-like permease
MRAFIYLITIYLIWGSTYLAMRIGVMEGSGFPPFALAGSRMLLAGPVLLLISYFKGNSIKLDASNFKRAFISGCLLWCSGHGLILWGEQYVDSGYTALIISSLPVWVLVMESFWNKKLPGLIQTSLVFFGLIGVLLLVYPKLYGDQKTDLVSTIAILIGTVSWGAGSLYQKRYPLPGSSLTSSGYQQLFAGIVLLLISFLSSEPIPRPVSSAILAWLYLVVFGSIIAFTVYVKALKELPAGVVMTHAYVNPIVAVTLGYLILSEPVMPMMLLGGSVILASVFAIIVRKK